LPLVKPLLLPANPAPTPKTQGDPLGWYWKA
jgi:hypothetical protein